MICRYFEWILCDWVGQKTLFSKVSVENYGYGFQSLYHFKINKSFERLFIFELNAIFVKSYYTQ